MIPSASIIFSPKTGKFFKNAWKGKKINKFERKDYEANILYLKISYGFLQVQIFSDTAAKLSQQIRPKYSRGRLVARESMCTRLLSPPNLRRCKENTSRRRKLLRIRSTRLVEINLALFFILKKTWKIKLRGFGVSECEFSRKKIGLVLSKISKFWKRKEKNRMKMFTVRTKKRNFPGSSL